MSHARDQELNHRCTARCYNTRGKYGPCVSLARGRDRDGNWLCSRHLRARNDRHAYEAEKAAPLCRACGTNVHQDPGGLCLACIGSAA